MEQTNPDLAASEPRPAPEQASQRRRARRRAVAGMAFCIAIAVRIVAHDLSNEPGSRAPKERSRTTATTETANRPKPQAVVNEKPPSDSPRQFEPPKMQTVLGQRAGNGSLIAPTPGWTVIPETRDGLKPIPTAPDHTASELAARPPSEPPSTTLSIRPVAPHLQVSWYLMVPPLDPVRNELDRTAPPSQWSVIASYSNQGECSSALVGPGGQPVYRTAVCLAANDPRLKSN